MGEVVDHVLSKSQRHIAASTYLPAEAIELHHHMEIQAYSGADLLPPWSSKRIVGHQVCI